MHPSIIIYDDKEMPYCEMTLIKQDGMTEGCETEQHEIMVMITYCTVLNIGIKRSYNVGNSYLEKKEKQEKAMEFPRFTETLLIQCFS